MSDPVEQRVLDDIARFGWHLIQINADEAQPGFVYSIGMMETLGHPEIIMFGLARQLMGTVINDMGRQIRAGRNFAELGLFEDLLQGYACKIIPVHKRWHTRYLGYAMWHRRHVGKIGTLGLRVIFANVGYCGLIALFAKNEQSNLNAAQKAQARRLIAGLKAHLKR